MAQRKSLLTTWLIPETLDCKMVTASPMEGLAMDLLVAAATAEVLKLRVAAAVNTLEVEREVNISVFISLL